MHIFYLNKEDALKRGEHFNVQLIKTHTRDRSRQLVVFTEDGLSPLLDSSRLSASGRESHCMSHSCVSMLSSSSPVAGSS